MNGIKKTTVLIFTVFAFLFASVGVSAAEVCTTHTVVSGDTCYKIAQAYGIAQSAVVNANGLTSDGTLIYPGQTLVIDSNAKNTNGGNYTVKSGDSLYKIASAYGTTVTALKTVNNLTGDRIYCGQVLCTGSAASNQTSAATATSVTTTNSSSLSEAEINQLAKMIYAEARGESYTGQVAVGAVIMNRIESDLFPDTLEGVLYQTNQFTAITDGQFDAATPDSTALAAAYDAAKGTDPTNGSLYYWNPAKTSNAYLNAKTILATIGSHVFAK